MTDDHTPPTPAPLPEADAPDGDAAVIDLLRSAIDAHKQQFASPFMPGDWHEKAFVSAAIDALFRRADRLTSERDAADARERRYKAVLKSIQEIAADDLDDIEQSHGSIVRTLEAIARAALESGTR